MNEESFFITFKTTHDALKFEKEASLAGYKSIIMPVPRDISTSCGLALRFNFTDLENIKQLIGERSLSIDNIYHITHKKNKKNN